MKKFFKHLFKKDKMQDINYLKKQYKRSQLEILFLGVALIAVILYNYNYIMLKTKIASDYIYSEALDDISQKHLGHSFNSKDFDLLTIALYGEKLQKEDKYFRLFKQGEYHSELKEMENEGEKTKVTTTEKGSGVITFSLFTDSAVKNVKENADTLRNCSTIIIDLRDNTGGKLNCAKEFAEMFLDEGQIIYGTHTKKCDKTIKSNTSALFKPEKIVILQNGYTASASEVFIMALKDNLDNVVIIGETSFGKGIGQNEYRLMGGYAFKLTSIRMKTPSGKSIHESGILPDVEYNEDKDIIEFAENYK